MNTLDEVRQSYDETGYTTTWQSVERGVQVRYAHYGYEFRARFRNSSVRCGSLKNAQWVRFIMKVFNRLPPSERIQLLHTIQRAEGGAQ